MAAVGPSTGGLAEHGVEECASAEVCKTGRMILVSGRLVAMGRSPELGSRGQGATEGDVGPMEPGRRG